MRKYLLASIVFSCQLCFSQEKTAFNSHQLSIDFGSYRNRYLYPVTDIQYSSPLLQAVNLKFSTRLRSYGTLFFFSQSAYDLTPMAEYYFSREAKTLYFSVGLGLDARIRLVPDERSEAISSVEPMLTFTTHVNLKKIAFNVPLWTRFYSNGISLALLPEVTYRIHERASIFLRYEMSYLMLSNSSSSEFRQDDFFGVQYYF